MRWLEPLSRLMLALWWGSLTSLGAWVVPQLFTHSATPAAAGALAAHLFTFQNALGLVAAGLILTLQVVQGGWKTLGRWPQAKPMAVVALAIGVSQYGVFPLIMARENLMLWHSVGSGLFVLEWLCLSLLMWRQSTV